MTILKLAIGACATLYLGSYGLPWYSNFLFTCAAISMTYVDWKKE